MFLCKRGKPPKGNKNSENKKAQLNIPLDLCISSQRSYISPMFLKELEDVSVREEEIIFLETVIEAYPTIGVVW